MVSTRSKWHAPRPNKLFNGSTVVVNYPPGGTTPAHYHADSAFVTGYVLSGSIRSEVNDGKTQVFHAGEHWTEPPGAYHPISENASATEPASLLAIFVVDTTDADAWSRTSGNENPLERRRGVHYA